MIRHHKALWQIEVCLWHTLEIVHPCIVSLLLKARMKHAELLDKHETWWNTSTKPPLIGLQIPVSSSVYTLFMHFGCHKQAIPQITHFGNQQEPQQWHAWDSHHCTSKNDIEIRENNGIQWVTSAAQWRYINQQGDKKRWDGHGIWCSRVEMLHHLSNRR